MARNISKVYLLDVPMEDDLKNTLYFASASAQQTYFQSVIGKTYTDVSYQSETRTFRCKDELEVVRKYNYIMWQNTSYSNKWFYGFITKATHISDGLTDIQFEVDPIQTFMFDITVKPSFIEREHTNDDTIGANTVLEGLDVGEYEIVDLKNIPIYETVTPSTDWTVAFVTSKLPDNDKFIKNESDLLGGVFNSLHIFGVENIAQARNLLYIYNEEGRGCTGDDIKNIYMIPSACLNKSFNLPTEYWTTIDGQSKVAVCRPLYNYYLFDDGGNPFEYRQPTVLAENYTPVNKKLYCWPYSYFYITNNAGTDVKFNWEDMPSLTAGQYDTGKAFKYRKAVVPTVSLSAKLYPTSYKTYSDNGTTPTCMYNYGINFAKTPVCSWITDYYTNWLTQNGVNVGVNAAQTMAGGLGAGIGLMNMGAGIPGLAVGVAGGAIKAISDALVANHNAEITPNQASGDLNSSDVMYAFSRCSMKLYMMSVRPEVARIVDGYFSMYGYKVNRLKTPNVAHRQNWWYTKTIGANIVGNVPNDYMTKIKKAYDDGITYWRTPANFLDYSKPNGIV